MNVKLQEVKGFPVLPGQYSFDTKGRVIMACPVCAYVFLCTHTVLQREPLTLSPSVVGPGKEDVERVRALSRILARPCLHHFWVRDGFAVDVGNLTTHAPDVCPVSEGEHVWEPDGSTPHKCCSLCGTRQ